MKQHVRFKNISDPSHEGLTREVASLAQRHLERHLVDMQPDLVHLYAIVEKNRHHNLYRVALRLHIPHRILVAREDGYDLLPAMRTAFEELERQLERHLEHLRRSHEWRRKGRHRVLDRLKSTLDAIPAAERKSFAEVVQPHLRSLTAFVRRELTYHQASGDLPMDEPNVVDVVDETLVRAASRMGEGQAPIDSAALQGIAVEILTEAIEAARRERPDCLSLEARPSADAMALVTEDDLLDFYQPDEALRIEDLVPASDAEPPEEALERQQFRTYVCRLLAELPPTWRRAWLLQRVDGRPIDEVTRILGVDANVAQNWSALANSFLRERLRTAGARVHAEAALESYLKQPELPEGTARLVIELEHAFAEIAA